MASGSAQNGMVNLAATTGRRRSRRKPVMWAARLETEDSETAECAAFDVSLGGAKVRVEAPVALYRPVLLVFERFGGLRAEPLWRRGSIMGLRFDEQPEFVRQMLGDVLSN
jgi:hypothetical protein